MVWRDRRGAVAGSARGTDRRALARRLTAVAAVALLLSVAAVGGVWAASGTWLRNLGFEQGLTYWTVAQPVTGSAVAVGTEGPAQFRAYSLMGVTVKPLSGQKMLRLGIPKDSNSRAMRGSIVAKQSFTSDGRPIQASFRMFTYEHFSLDTLTVDVKDASGRSYGKVSGRSLPYRAMIVMTKWQKYKDTGWTPLTITGLPTGKTLTLTYTLSNPFNYVHDTWVYLDYQNQRPLAGTVALTPDPPGTNDILTAAPSGFSDPDGGALTYHYVWRNGTTTVGSDSSTLDLALAGNGDPGDNVSVSCTASDGDLSSTAATDSVTVTGGAPTADFTWAPGGPGGEKPHEGDMVGLYADVSTDPDGAEDIVKWEWTISRPPATPVVYNDINDFQSPVGFIVPDKEGAYEVTLKVTDSSGLSDSKTQTIDVQNYAPRVNALNIEVLPGGTANLFGRFIDPGWTDDHTATFAPAAGGDDSAGTVEEDHAATISSGKATGTAVAGPDPVQSDWVLTVDDGKDQGTDPFKVSVVWPDPQRFEWEETLPDPAQLNSDGAYLSWVQSKGDVDVFEVRLPDGSLLPQGTEILATLRNLPGDYDLVMFEGTTGGETAEGGQTAPFMHSSFSSAPFMHSALAESDAATAPFMHSPFMHSAYQDTPFMHSPFMHSAYLDSAYVNAPFMHSPFMHSPFSDSPFMHSPLTFSPFMHSETPTGWGALDGYPFSEMSFLGNTGGNTSGSDIAVEELGLDLGAMQNVRVLGFSANTGTEAEVVLGTAGYPQTAGVQGRVYVAVSSSAGAYSADLPYTIQIETSRGEDLLSTGQTEQPPVVADPTTATDALNDPALPLTLFVTQLDRLAALYPAGSLPGDARDGGAIVEEALTSVADRADVDGRIISLPGDIYTAWDKEPWRVDLANGVADAIRAEVQDQLDTYPTIEYVVLVGDDRIVPSRRLIDQTIIGNEQDYLNQSFLTAPSATLSSIGNGFILTDDFYVDQAPIAWSGSSIYVPDLSVSRLVETPTEIAGAIAAFVAADGVLTADVGLVSGYDFMADGAQAVRDVLTGAGLTVNDSTPSLIGDSWHGSDLWNLLNAGVAIADINAHFTHFAGLSAYGFGQSVASGTYGDAELVTSKDLAAAGAGALFKNALIFSMGCHSGLNVPDEQTVALSADSVIDPALDIPQAIMRQGGVYAGSTGYGYGDTVGIAGTEALIGDFARHLVGSDSPEVTPAETVGLALAQAKQAYFGALSAVTPYEQKSSAEYVMYGMPQYRLVAAPASVVRAPVATKTATSTAAKGAAVTATASLDSFHLTVIESAIDGDWTASTLDQLYDLMLNTTTAGQYITADGAYGAAAERPIHPLAQVPLGGNADKGPAHGVIYKGGTFATLSDTFDPVISRFTVEWEVGAEEFQVAPSGFWPGEPALLNTLETPVGYDQNLLVVPAQFQATQTSPTVKGAERVWSALDLEVLRATLPEADAEDWLAPTVLGTDVRMTGSTATLSVDAYDESGIPRIVVLMLNATGMWVPTGGDAEFGDGQANTDAGRYELSFDTGSTAPADLALLIQVVDGRGNVTTLTGKGASVRLASGVQNTGFEQGLDYWNATQPAAGYVTTMETDQEVSPYSGGSMLRLSMPLQPETEMLLGTNSVSQTFISNGADVYVAYRVITTDRPGGTPSNSGDAFTVKVTDGQGNVVGSWASPGSITTTPLPRVHTTDFDPQNTYQDTYWVTIRLTDLPADQLLTLTYQLETQDTGHISWTYVDDWSQSGGQGPY